MDSFGCFFLFLYFTKYSIFFFCVCYCLLCLLFEFLYYHQQNLSSFTFFFSLHREIKISTRRLRSVNSNDNNNNALFFLKHWGTVWSNQIKSWNFIPAVLYLMVSIRIHLMIQLIWNFIPSYFNKLLHYHFDWSYCHQRNTMSNKFNGKYFYAHS